LNVLVAVLLGGHGHRQEGGDGHDHSDAKKKKKKTSRKDVKSKNEDAFAPTCCNKDPVSQLENFQKMASFLEHEQEEKEGTDKYQSDTDMDVALDIDDDFVDNLPLEDNVSEVSGNDNAHVHAHDDEEVISEDKKATEENEKLVKMGMNTAIAIGLHNFPEGLATFVATLNDPKVGAILAVAIAIHNIPEGLCVALPIFYATGDRRKAFLWALLSGASEFVAALLGWAVLANNFSYNSYAILFGLVAGMMVVISIRELLPTAHFYDPEDTVVTYSFIFGMALIAFSLVLFKL
jgi:ZIP family zinc transporter